MKVNFIKQCARCWGAALSGFVGGCISILMYLVAHGMKIKLETCAELISAIGTLSAVIVSLWLAREKKTKLNFSAIKKLDDSESKLNTRIDISNLSSVGTTLNVIEYQIDDSQLVNVKEKDSAYLANMSQDYFDFTQFSLNKSTTCYLPARSTRSVTFDWTSLKESLKGNQTLSQEMNKEANRPWKAVITFRDIDGKQYRYQFNEYSKMVSA